MAPCGGNLVTPKMIRKGEIHIGDRIHFEDEMTSSGNLSEVSSSVTEESKEAAVISSSEPQAAPVSRPVPVSQAAPVSSAASETNASAATEETVAVQSRTAPGMMQGMSGTQGTQGMPGTQGMQSARNTQMQGTQSAQGMQSMQGMQGIPNMGMQNTTVDDNGVTRRQTTAPMSFGQPNTPQQQTVESFPLNFSGMTDYVNSLAAAGGQSPSFNVPSHPMVPPEYEQTIDYDSIQYMNGFLRTQIGRYVRVEQLIGSGNTEERFGFLVGVGNNYLLLQDISNGNILVVDFYSVKFVYIYFGEPVFPNIPFGPAVG